MAKSPTRSQSPTNGWDVLRFVVNRAFNSGYALPAIGGLIFLASLWIVVQKLDSKDLKELVGEAFADWAAAVGSLLFLAGSAIYLSVVRWMKVRYEAEIARQRGLIDRLLPPGQKRGAKTEVSHDYFGRCILRFYSCGWRVRLVLLGRCLPCILLKSKLEFQKICDETRLAAREGKIPSESRGFIELQYFLDLERRAVSYPELLATGPLRKLTDSDLEELERRIDAIKQASPEIYEAFTRSQRWILALWFASRPSWLFLHGLLLALGLFRDWAAKAADREKKEAFAVASGLPPIDELCVFSTAAAR